MKIVTRNLGMISFCLLICSQHLIAQVFPHQAFIREVVDKTKNSMHEFAGLEESRIDTLVMPEGHKAVRILRIRTQVYKSAGRIYFSLDETMLDPKWEAPTMRWFGGLADVEGKIHWRVDSSDWIYYVLPEHYHPDAKYIVTIASVYEEYRPHGVAVLSPIGNVVYELDDPEQLKFNKDRSVFVAQYKVPGTGSTQLWRMRYRNLDSDQEWEKYFTGSRPFLHSVIQKDHSIIYSIQDTLFCDDYFGKNIWRTQIDKLASALLTNGDETRFFVLHKDGTVINLGPEAREVMYTFSLTNMERSNFTACWPVEDTPYAVLVEYVELGRSFKILGKEHDVLGEVIITEDPGGRIAGFYKKESGVIEVFSGNRLVYKWRDGDEGKNNQHGPE